MSATESGKVRPGLSVGPTSEFSLFFRVKAGEGENLRTALRDLQETPGYRPGDYGMAIATIHEARFVLFDDDTRLAFLTSFDGSAGTPTWTTSSRQGRRWRSSTSSSGTSRATRDCLTFKR